jgi:hypothetical protein
MPRLVTVTGFHAKKIWTNPVEKLLSEFIGPLVKIENSHLMPMEEGGHPVSITPHWNSALDDEAIIAGEYSDNLVGIALDQVHRPPPSDKEVWA